MIELRHDILTKSNFMDFVNVDDKIIKLNYINRTKFLVTNPQMAIAFMDSVNFKSKDYILDDASYRLKCIGSFCDVDIYVDYNLTWFDNYIYVIEKSDEDFELTHDGFYDFVKKNNTIKKNTIDIKEDISKEIKPIDGACPECKNKDGLKRVSLDKMITIDGSLTRKQEDIIYCRLCGWNGEERLLCCDSTTK